MRASERALVDVSRCACQPDGQTPSPAMGRQKVINPSGSLSSLFGLSLTLTSPTSWPSECELALEFGERKQLNGRGSCWVWRYNTRPGDE